MSTQGFSAALLLVLAGLGLSGCGGVAQVPTEAVANAPPVEAPNYLIGPGDGLQIFVWDHPELSTTITVRPDGKISSPLVSDLQAAGKSPTQLEGDIEQVLTEYVRAPVVTVIMQSFIGDSAQQIRIVGQAARPQALQYRQGMTLFDVMIQVGGLSEFAAGNRARIIRTFNGTTTEFRVRLDDLQNGDVSQNVRLMPGDVLVIPESIF